MPRNLLLSHYIFRNLMSTAFNRFHPDRGNRIDTRSRFTLFASVAPWFNQPARGQQYRTPVNLGTLRNRGLLKETTPSGILPFCPPRPRRLHKFRAHRSRPRQRLDKLDSVGESLSGTESRNKRPQLPADHKSCLRRERGPAISKPRPCGSPNGAPKGTATNPR